MKYVILLCLVSLMIIMPISAQDETLTIYSGRSESLMAPIFEQFTQDTGIEVEVLYGSTSAIANQIIEEGDASPADVFIAQDGGALGALANEEKLTQLPDELIEVVLEQFRSPDGVWVGLSGRARTLVYNPELLEELGLELPESIFDLTDEQWENLVGWAPTNASLQANVTAMRVELGDEATLQWLEDMVENGVKAYEKNTPIVEAVIAGEIPVGLVNHYYLFRFLAEDPDITTSLHYFPGGDLGSMVNVAGIGVLKTSDQSEESLMLVEYLLSETAQQYFADETYEYPLIDGIEINPSLMPLDEIESPNLDLTDLADLETTLEMIEESGALDY